MTTFYLDSSAITKLVLEEVGSAELRQRIEDAQLVSSRVAVVEVMKAVARVAPEADPGEVLDRLAFVELDADLAAQAGATGGPPLRALDAIHVASAGLLAGELDAFITFDTRQAVAAQEAGLHVVSFGLAAPGSLPVAEA